MLHRHCGEHQIRCVFCCCFQIERQIDIGNLTPGQKNILVGQLNQLYELQKLKSDQTSTLPELSDSSSLNTKPVHSESNQERFQIPNNAPQPSHHIGLDSGQVRGQAPYRRSGPRRPYRGRGSQVEMPPRVWPLDGGDPGRGMLHLRCYCSGFCFFVFYIIHHVLSCI